MQQENTSVKHFLRVQNPLLFKLIRALKHFPARLKRAFVPYRFRKYAEPFHGDLRWQELVSACAGLPITSCVETGTYHGDTTLFLSTIFSRLRIYTIELSREYYRESAWRLRTTKNIVLSRGSSPRVLKMLVAESRLGSLPLVFLDAHWYDYWPILDELRELAPLNKVVIMIDDFEVPGKPWFEYDVYYEGKKTLKNNLDFIRPALLGKYRAIFPAYAPRESETGGSALRGYVALFRNFSSEEWKNALSVLPMRHFNEFDVERGVYI